MEWLEEKRGHGTVSLMNETMRRHRYDEVKFWKSIFGTSVQELWSDYKKTWDKPKQENLDVSSSTGGYSEQVEDRRGGDATGDATRQEAWGAWEAYRQGS